MYFIQLRLFLYGWIEAEILRSLVYLTQKKKNFIEYNKQLITIQLTGYQKAKAIYAGYPNSNPSYRHSAYSAIGLHAN